MKNIKELKTYESPSLTVTELNAEDIIMVSGLITANEILGHGTIDWAEINIEIDLQ